MKETWKPVSGYEGLYEVSNRGGIRSFHKRRSGRKLRPYIGNYGYPRIILRKEKTRKYCFVHRLVLSAFVGECSKGYQCGHLNGVKTDNRLENLAWITKEENERQKVHLGEILKGEKHGNATISDAKAREVVLLLRRKTSHKAIVKELCVSKHIVGHISRGNKWKHIIAAVEKELAPMALGEG